jgi:hypothetical protein
MAAPSLRRFQPDQVQRVAQRYLHLSVTRLPGDGWSLAPDAVFCNDASGHKPLRPKPPTARRPKPVGGGAGARGGV